MRRKIRDALLSMTEIYVVTSNNTAILSVHAQIVHKLTIRNENFELRLVDVDTFNIGMVESILNMLWWLQKIYSKYKNDHPPTQ